MSERLLCTVGRPPGSRCEVPDHDGRGNLREDEERLWERDVPRALAAIALLREILSSPVPARTLIELFRSFPYRSIAPLRKRDGLLTNGLIAVVPNTVPPAWDLTDMGRDGISGDPIPLVTETVIRRAAAGALAKPRGRSKRPID